VSSKHGASKAVSRENVEIARIFFAALERGDPGAFLPMLDARVAWKVADDEPDGSLRRWAVAGLEE